MCSREEFWNTLSVGYKPWNEEPLELTDLMPIVSMIVKIIHRNIYPHVGYLVRPYFQVLAATLCILKCMQVNWSSLLMHAMSRCLKDTGHGLYFPRLITMILEKKGAPMKELKSCKLIAMESKAFRCWYVNCFQAVNENSEEYAVGMFELLAQVSMLERSLLTMKTSTDEHANRMNQIDRRMVTMEKVFAWLETWVKNQEESVDLMLQIMKTNFKHITVSVEESCRPTAPHPPATTMMSPFAANRGRQ